MQTPPRCSIVYCPNSVYNVAQSTIFYFVPKDAPRMNQWANALKDHIGDTPISQALLCIKHFGRDAFENNSIKLTETACPTIFPTAEAFQPPRKKRKTTIDTPQQSTKLVNLGQSKLSVLNGTVVNLEANLQQSHEVQNLTRPIPSVSDDSASNLGAYLREILQPENNLAHEEALGGTEGVDDGGFDECITIRQINRLINVKRELTRVLGIMLKEDTKLSEELTLVRKEIKKKEIELINMPQSYSDLLKKCFSPCQIRRLQRDFRSSWSADDLIMSYTLCCLTSREFCSSLRSELNFPIPPVTAIDRCDKTKRVVNRNNNGNSKNDE